MGQVHMVPGQPPFRLSVLCVEPRALQLASTHLPLPSASHTPSRGLYFPSLCAAGSLLARYRR